MRKLEQIKVKLYVVLAVLVVSFSCICIYRSAVTPKESQQPRPVPHTDEQLAGADQSSGQKQQENRPVTASAPGSKEVSEDVPAGYTIEPESTQTTYALAVADGCLQVYILETGQLYMETTIAYDLLPENVRAQIDTGKQFDTEASLLEFLESYSS